MADAKPSRPIREVREPVAPADGASMTLPEPGEGVVVSKHDFKDKDGNVHVIETYK